MGESWCKEVVDGGEVVKEVVDRGEVVEEVVDEGEVVEEVVDEGEVVEEVEDEGEVVEEVVDGEEDAVVGGTTSGEVVVKDRWQKICPRNSNYSKSQMSEASEFADQSAWAGVQI